MTLFQVVCLALIAAAIVLPSMLAKHYYSCYKKEIVVARKHEDRYDGLVARVAADEKYRQHLVNTEVAFLKKAILEFEKKCALLEAEKLAPKSPPKEEPKLQVSNNILDMIIEEKNA